MKVPGLPGVAGEPVDGEGEAGCCEGAAGDCAASGDFAPPCGRGFPAASVPSPAGASVCAAVRPLAAVVLSSSGSSA